MNTFDYIVGEALKSLKGDKPGAYYISGFIFATMGLIVSMWYSSRKRDKASASTPKKFSIEFLIGDNMRRAVVSIIVIYILFRGFNLDSFWAQLGVGAGVAASLDAVIAILMEKFDLLGFLKSARKRESDEAKKAKEDSGTGDDTNDK